VKTIKVAFYREGNQWVAQALDVEVSTFADTLDKTRAAIQEALELYFDDN
jgi:predicted RNase H-like HicB family nuclease